MVRQTRMDSEARDMTLGNQGQGNILIVFRILAANHTAMIRTPQTLNPPLTTLLKIQVGRLPNVGATRDQILVVKNLVSDARYLVVRASYRANTILEDMKD